MYTLLYETVGEPVVDVAADILRTITTPEPPAPGCELFIFPPPPPPPPVLAVPETPFGLFCVPPAPPPPAPPAPETP